MAPDPGPLWNHRVGQQRSIGVTLPLNYSRALRRPSGQSGPSPRGVGNETDFQKNKNPPYPIESVVRKKATGSLAGFMAGPASLPPCWVECHLVPYSRLKA